MSTYRQIYLYGDKREPEEDKHLTQFLTERFGKSPFLEKANYEINDHEVKLKETDIDPVHLQHFANIVGRENMSTSSTDRAAHAYGKFYGDLLRLRLGEIIAPPQLVLHPEGTTEIEAIVNYCNAENIPIVPYGGGTSVTRALEAPRGGVSISLRKRHNKILEINEINQTVKVQTGILGPELEKQLNAKAYACGHYPQSFEFSTVGGWIAARGAGQCSTGYGRIEDILVAMQVVCPSGLIETKNYPAAAQGINTNEVFAGSEGTLGVITEATLKIFPYHPHTWEMGSFVFKNFETGVNAMREFIQSENGFPHVFRLSDGLESNYFFHLKGKEKGLENKLLGVLGYPSPQRSFMYYTAQGSITYNHNISTQLKKITRKHKGLYIGKSVIKKWLDIRYESSYIRDFYMDRGYFIDTMETAVAWDQLIVLWKALEAFFKKHPQYEGFSHISHVYQNGANIYIIFQGRIDEGNPIASFETFHRGIIEVIRANGGSLSHHHGVGRMLAEYLPLEYGATAWKMYKDIKKSLDPNNIMNPGGTLGFE